MRSCRVHDSALCRQESLPVTQCQEYSSWDFTAEKENHSRSTKTKRWKFDHTIVSSPMIENAYLLKRPLWYLNWHWWLKYIPIEQIMNKLSGHLHHLGCGLFHDRDEDMFSRFYHLNGPSILLLFSFTNCPWNIINAIFFSHKPSEISRTDPTRPKAPHTMHITCCNRQYKTGGEGVGYLKGMCTIRMWT